MLVDANSPLINIESGCEALNLCIFSSTTDNPPALKRICGSQMGRDCPKDQQHQTKPFPYHDPLSNDSHWREMMKEQVTRVCRDRNMPQVTSSLTRSDIS